MFNSNLFQRKPRIILRFVYFSVSTITSLFSPAKLLAQVDTKLFVPIILSSAGENGSFFTSELTLTNRGATDVTLDYTYTAAFGGGSGVALDSLPAGQQRIISDAIVHLKSLGVPIPESGNRGGTLSVQVHNLASASDFGITVRTTTPQPGGRAGLAYAAVNQSEGLHDISYLFGLRQNATDRSNVAIQNMASPDQGDIILSVSVFAGNPSERAPTLPFSLTNIKLSPGEWHQISGILRYPGLSLSNGYVRIEKVEGSAPYYAYAVINDQNSSDGSFIPPIAPQSSRSWTLPVIVENGAFSSELVVTNLSSFAKLITLRDNQNRFPLTTIGVGEQIIIPDLVQYLRDHGVSNVGSSGQPYVGTISVDGCGDPDCSKQLPYYLLFDNVFLGVRTSAPSSGGRYGVYYPGVPWGLSSTNDAWLYDLQQDADNRSNVALVNTGEDGNGADIFRIDLFDGSNGQKVHTIDGIFVGAHQWVQIGSILAKSGLPTSQGYAHVIQTSGSNPFLTYAVINDGGQPGTGTGDGAFVASSKQTDPVSLVIDIQDKNGCDHFPWSLKISHAPPNVLIRLVGDSAGLPSDIVLPPGAKTDAQGNLSTAGIITRTSGSFSVVAYVGNLRSNMVSLHVFNNFCD